MWNHLLKRCTLGWMSLLPRLLLKLLAGLLLLAYRLTLIKLIPYLCCWCQIHPFRKTQTALRIQNDRISTNRAIVPGVLKKKSSPGHKPPKAKAAYPHCTDVSYAAASSELANFCQMVNCNGLTETSLRHVSSPTKLYAILLTFTK